MKTCNKCGIEKEISCFSKNRNTEDGLQWWCKDCKKTHDAARFLNVGARSAFLFTAAKQRAERRGGKITITPDWIAEKINKGCCELTALPFDLSPTSSTRVNPYAPSVDRVNKNNPNYSPTNSRIVLAAVNAALNEWDLDVLKPIFKILGGA